MNRSTLSLEFFSVGCVLLRSFFGHDASVSFCYIRFRCFYFKVKLFKYKIYPHDGLHALRTRDDLCDKSDTFKCNKLDIFITASAYKTHGKAS